MRKGEKVTQFFFNSAQHLQEKEKTMRKLVQLLMAFVIILGGCDFYESADINNNMGVGGSGPRFKIPLPPGYNWEVTQSWAEHCQLCNDKGYDRIFGGFFGDFCEGLSHSSTCYNSCKYAWDFNLPGEADHGKPVLATGEGYVRHIGNNSWGNHIILDHGDNICSRYAHLRNNSITVQVGEFVCQGLKIGEIGDTGASFGSHLHFQFERCDNLEPLRMGFDDGNGVPVCTMGNDVLSSNGNYNFLILTNNMVTDCAHGQSTFGGGEFTHGGWRNASCGSLSGCPLIPNCNRNYGHLFPDFATFDAATASAAAYLHSECVLDGKANGMLMPNSTITRAEALKVALHLFGLSENCRGTVSFEDVNSSKWYYETVQCGLFHGVIEPNRTHFLPNDPVNLAEAAKILVTSAMRAGVVQLRTSALEVLNVSSSHWSYPYFATLYHYGGIYGNNLSLPAHSDVRRGVYFIMTASLSPCYCENVVCQRGCRCDQATTSCVNPMNNNPGVGGNQVYEEDNYYDPAEEFEVYEDPVPPPQSSSGGGSDSSVDSYDYHYEADEPDPGHSDSWQDEERESEDPVPPPPQDNSGGGSQPPQDDSGGSDQPPQDNSGGGGQPPQDDSGGSGQPPQDDSSGGGDSGGYTPPPTNPPSQGGGSDTLKIFFLGRGVLDFLFSGGRGPETNYSLASFQYDLPFGHRDFPAAVLVIVESAGEIQLSFNGRFEVWLNYSGPLTLNPSGAPHLTANSVFSRTFSSAQTFLVKLYSQ
jgi:hypothetical protein